MSGTEIQPDPRSLTPNQDAAAQFLARVRRRLSSRGQLPGIEGMIARMQMVLLADLATIVSGERDCGATDRDTRTALAIALGDLVASAAITLGGEADALFEAKVAAIALFVDVVRARAIKSAGEGEIEHMHYQQPVTGKG